MVLRLGVWFETGVVVCGQWSTLDISRSCEITVSSTVSSQILYLRPYLSQNLHCTVSRRIIDRIFDRIFHKTFTVLYLRRIFDCIFDRIFVSSRYGTCPVDTSSHSPNLRTIRRGLGYSSPDRTSRGARGTWHVRTSYHLRHSSQQRFTPTTPRTRTEWECLIA